MLSSLTPKSVLIAINMEEGVGWHRGHNPAPPMVPYLGLHWLCWLALVAFVALVGASLGPGLAHGSC
jgi:hypothetical protein